MKTTGFVDGKKKIGVYLGAKPFIGGSFQYNQSILDALKNLPIEKYSVYAFFQDDLWDDYLLKYQFVKKKVFTPRQLFDVFGAMLFKLAKYGWIRLSDHRWLFARLSKFSRQFDEENLDIIIFPAQEIFPAVITTKSVGVIHDLMHRYEKFPEMSSPEEFVSRERLYSSICSSASRIFVDSELGKKQVMECYGNNLEDIISVMPYTPPQYLFSDELNLADCDMELPAKFMFYPAQFWRHKNHIRLIEAVKKLKDDNVDVKMIFVGSEKNGYDDVLKAIEKYKLEENIKILGYVSDSKMRYLYKHATAMIMPSFAGPTNIPPLEGMSMGCPVAVADNYAMPWQVQDAGLTFSPNSVDEIANTIKMLWTDEALRNRLSRKGLERAKVFSQENFNKRLYDVIKLMLLENS